MSIIPDPLLSRIFFRLHEAYSLGNSKPVVRYLQKDRDMPNIRRRRPAGKLMLYMDADVIASLKRYATGTEQSCNAVMSKAISAYLDEKRGA
ncbi:MAG: hypothetical protein WA864_00590 [Acetobacteraceae bacterium]